MIANQAAVFPALLLTFTQANLSPNNIASLNFAPIQTLESSIWRESSSKTSACYSQSVVQHELAPLQNFSFFPPTNHHHFVEQRVCVSVWVLEMLYHFCVSFREHHFFPLRPSRLLQCHLVKQHFPLAAFSLVFFSVRFSLHSQRRSCFATFLTARANKRST